MIVVNKNCIGCGACEAIAPEDFEVIDIASGYYSVPKSRITGSYLSNNLCDAIDSCPVGAIEDIQFESGFPESILTKESMENAVEKMKKKFNEMKTGSKAEESLISAINETENFLKTYNLRDK